MFCFKKECFKLLRLVFDVTVPSLWKAISDMGGAEAPVVSVTSCKWLLYHIRGLDVGLLCSQIYCTGSSIF